MPKKGEGAWTVCPFKGGLARKRRVVFLRGGYTPIHTTGMCVSGGKKCSFFGKFGKHPF